MHNAIGISRKTTAVLLGVSAAGFIFNSIIYIMLHQKINLGQDITAFADRVSVYVGISTILLLLFHFAAIATTLLTLRVAKKDSVLQAFIFFLSIISTVMIAGDFALCSDIVKEYGAGLTEGILSEFIILYLWRWADRRYSFRVCNTLFFTADSPYFLCICNSADFNYFKKDTPR